MSAPDAYRRSVSRKALDSAERAARWLVRTEIMDGEDGRALSESASATIDGLRDLLAGIAVAPTIALTGAASGVKYALADALLTPAGLDSGIVLGPQTSGPGTVASLLPAGGTADLTAALRLVKAKGSSKDQAGEAFPVRVELFGLADVVRLMTSLYHLHIPEAWQQRVTPADVRDAVDRSAADRMGHAVPGLTAADVTAIREHIANRYPQSPLTRDLAAAGYWDWLSANIEVLAERGRRPVLSLLWGGDSTISSIFHALSETLERLGHATRIDSPREALFQSDRDSGWVVRHPHSILSRQTLAGLAFEALNASRLHVGLRHGMTAEIERGVLAALAREVVIRVDGAHLLDDESADLVIYPDVVRLSMSAPVPDSGGADLIDRFAHTKSVFLLERAAARLEIDYLVAASDKDVDDDALAAAFAHWVDMIEGSEPRERERMPVMLTVVTTGQGPRHAELSRGIAAGGTWLENWQPGRSFRGIETVRPAADGHGASLRGEPDVVAAGAAIRASWGRARSMDVRSIAVRRRVVQLQSALKDRLVRYHRSGDTLLAADWRRQMTNVVVNRLELVRERRGLGLLLGNFFPSEVELIHVLERVAAEQWDDARLRTTRSTAPGASELRVTAEAAASAMVSHWLSRMNETARSCEVARRTGLSSPLLRHVADELTLGCQRLEVPALLARDLRRHQTGEGGEGIRTVRYAAQGLRTISSFIETPARPTAAAASYAPASGDPPALPAPLNGRGHSNGEQHAHTAAGRTAFQERWIELFRDLVEGNISASSSFAVHAGLDRELGELLATLSSQSAEVDL